jgi:hypothetical protein
MLLCRLNKIHFLYLPAHASDLLQPLELAPCSVLKTRYRNEIRALSALDDAAPVKKERFVISYNKAREEALSERVIRAGWRAAGPCPFNPSLVLLSSQVAGRLSTPPHPQASAAACELILTTPRSSQSLYKAQQQLLLSETLSRSTRSVLGKAGKAIAAANTRATQLEAENQRLLHQLDHHKVTRTRKRVQVNPDERFSNVEAIQAAINRAAALQARQAASSAERAAQTITIATTTLTFDSMCTQWQT